MSDRCGESKVFKRGLFQPPFYAQLLNNMPQIYHAELSLNRLDHNRTYLRMVLWLLVIVTLVILFQSSLLAARTQKRGESVLSTGEVVYVPAEAQTRLMYLGYEQAAADVIWVRTLNYFARHFVTDRKYPWLRHFLDQILALDPEFHDVYLWAGSSLLYGRLLTNERVLEANQYYERALERFPNDHEAAYRLGMNYHAELISDDEDERSRFRRKGLYYLELAANMPDAPKRIGELVACSASNMVLMTWRFNI